jgi:hypothetical protein
MKKFMILVTLMAFFVSAPLAMAQHSSKKEATKYKCCVKGECKDLTKKECKKQKGKYIKATDCEKKCK